MVFGVTLIKEIRNSCFKKTKEGLKCRDQTEFRKENSCRSIKTQRTKQRKKNKQIKTRGNGCH